MCAVKRGLTISVMRMAVTTSIPLRVCIISLSCLQHKFFYSLVYDTSQKTLVEESGEIRIGPKYQADIPEFIDTDFPCEHRLFCLFFCC